jgi:hypothetical protein
MDAEIRGSLGAAAIRIFIIAIGIFARRGSPGGRGICQAASFVIVGLERVEKAGNRFTHAIAIARRSIVLLGKIAVEPMGLERFFAQNGEGTFIGIVNVMKEHSNGAAKRGDFGLKVDDAVRGFDVHAATIGAKTASGQRGSLIRLLRVFV